MCLQARFENTVGKIAWHTWVIGGVVKKMCFAAEGLILLTSEQDKSMFAWAEDKDNMKLRSVS